MFKSLTSRFMAYAGLWATICIFVAGILITENFRKSAERELDQRLDVAVKHLVAQFAGQLASGEALALSEGLGDPLFDLPLSGWYWSISKGGEEILLSSPSLVSGAFSISEPENIGFDQENRRFGPGMGPDRQTLRILERKISLGPDNEFLFRVSANADNLAEKTQEFKSDAWLTMGIVVALPLLSIFLIVRISLQPLYKLQDRIRAVRRGQTNQISGNYPSEVSGLVDEANALIRSNSDLAERARMQVGNLAHALKTPLSVIINECGELKGESGKRITLQAHTMSDQIHLYLERARMAARSNVLGSVTELEPVLSKLTNVMTKIYSAQSLKFNLQVQPGLQFQGEEHDLEEMVGNLVDNACKWAKSEVHIHAELLSCSASDVERQCLTIIIEDDGPGLSEEQRKEVRRRGYRLDESKPGSGLGLSIVDELAHLYKGSFTLSVSELGGLKVELTLPASSL